MKLLMLTLLCLLLTGCGQEPTQPTTPTQAPEAPQTMAAPDHPLAGEDLQVYSLAQRKVCSLRFLGEDLLLLSGQGSSTLTRLSGTDYRILGEITLEIWLDPEDPSLQTGPEGLSYYDPATRETVLLDQTLQEVRRIPVPEEAVGAPILSQDGKTLFYTTDRAIFALDPQTNRSRQIKAMTQDQQLTALHFGDTMLQYETSEGTCFLDTASGRELGRSEIPVTLTGTADQYQALLERSTMDLVVFGSGKEKPMLLCPEDPAARLLPLPEAEGVLAFSANREEVRIIFYDLSDGTQRGSLTLGPCHTPKSVLAREDGCLLLIYDPETDADLLLHWQLPQTPEGPEVYTFPYTPGDSLSQCRILAHKLEETYGIPILLNQEAVEIQPWDYEFSEEPLAPVLMRELKLLDQRLAIFPAGMLEATASHFDSLQLCLVGQIQGTPASGSLAAATGVQFFRENDACIAIAAGRHSWQALYHELFHVMETHILNESIAFDQWEDLNPPEFSYAWGYEIPEENDQYLSGPQQAFLDRYSMSYPKEDRARIWEHALLPGNAPLFESPILQRKLQALCQGIREAYGLKKNPEVFPWEQYLVS